MEVSGTTIGPEHRHFLAGALGFAIDLQLSPRMVFFSYDDIPGVIGRVGTMFGAAGINIANMAVSRTKEGGKALMVLAIDSEPPPELVEPLPRRGIRRRARDRPRRVVASPGYSPSVQSSWPEPVERVAAFLREAGAEARLEEFESGTPTAEDAARAAGCTLGQIVKSLVLVCDGRPVLTLVPGDRRADTTKIAVAAGSASARIAKADEVERATGFPPGRSRRSRSRTSTRSSSTARCSGKISCWVGAGSPAHVAALRPAELVRLTRAQPIDAVQEPEYHSNGGDV